MAQADKNPKPITYEVNGDAETTTERALTVRQIIESAGFVPAEEYTLTSQNPKADYRDNYDEVIEIHPNQRFTALHKGPTPTS